MKNFNFSDKISIDADGNFNDAMNGKFGYRVFYAIPKEELLAPNLFISLPESCISGELEFTVNENGEQIGEVLLWATIQDEDDPESYTNEDFVNYEEDISAFVDDFNKRNKIITSKKDLIKYIYSDYQKYAVELNSLHFDVNVKMSERDILEAYAEIQHNVNGDFVCRLENPSKNCIEDNIADEFIPNTSLYSKYDEIYEGNCKDFLESFCGKEYETGFARLCDDEEGNVELLDFIL